jgi:phospholipid transport system substrate-binding protein
MAEVKQGVDEVLVVFHDHATPLRARREQLRQIAEEHFDFADMARSALGRHWRTLTPEQQAGFLPLFAAFIQDAYLSKLQEYTVRKIQEEAKTAKILFTRESFDGADADYAEVYSSIIVIDQQDPIPVNYMMHRRNGTWLIYDVTVENISVIANYRNQFDRVINRDGYDKLFSDLQSKQTQLEQTMNQPPAAEGGSR